MKVYIREEHIHGGTDGYAAARGGIPPFLFKVDTVDAVEVGKSVFGSELHVAADNIPEAVVGALLCFKILADGRENVGARLDNELDADGVLKHGIALGHGIADGVAELFGRFHSRKRP